METLWAICAWTGFVWWCCAFIAATVIAGVAVVEALCARWEEDEIRRVLNISPSDVFTIASGGRRDGSRDRPAREPGGVECLDCGCIFIGEDDHQLCGVCVKATFTLERDGRRSMREAWAELRQRKSGA